MEKLQEQQDISQIRIRELEGTNNNVNKFGTFNGFWLRKHPNKS